MKGHVGPKKGTRGLSKGAQHEAAPQTLSGALPSLSVMTSPPTQHRPQHQNSCFTLHSANDCLHSLPPFFVQSFCVCMRNNLYTCLFHSSELYSQNKHSNAVLSYTQCTTSQGEGTEERFLTAAELHRRGCPEPPGVHTHPLGPEKEPG